jgi:hypothetical protein
VIDYERISREIGTARMSTHAVPRWTKAELKRVKVEAAKIHRALNPELYRDAQDRRRTRALNRWYRRLWRRIWN